MIKRIEPFAYGYINSPSADTFGKIADGLFALCEYAPIVIKPEIGLAAFDRTVGTSFVDNLGAVYACGDGIIFSEEKFNKKIEENPECKEELIRYREIFRGLDTYSIVDTKLSKLQLKLRETNSIWMAAWGGHANPDFSLVGKIGTDGIREKIADYRKKNPGKDSYYDSMLRSLDALDLFAERGT